MNLRLQCSIRRIPAPVSSLSLSRASEIPPTQSIRPDFTASAPYRIVPISFAISSLEFISFTTVSRSAPEVLTMKSVMRSCVLRKYPYVCSAPIIIPVMRTGWSVIAALGAIKE